MEHIALIGLGPHAKRIYYPYIQDLVTKDKKFSFELLIDLESNREDIENFLNLQSIKPKNVLFLDAKSQISPNRIDRRARVALKKHKISKAIISTEPKAHKIYLKECVSLGIPVVVDKPITACKGIIPKWRLKKAPQYSKANVIYKDVIEIQKLIEKSPGSRVLVQCQRRNHKGYEIVRNIANEIVSTYNIPITYINIHHSDGMWNMPDEFLSRENHPYKYGYGKLMHSGYHFVDLLVSLIDINTQLKEKYPDKIEIFTQAVRPHEQNQTIAINDYANMFGNEAANNFKTTVSHKELSGCGEVDSFSQIRLSKNNRALTTVQLSLMQTGFSQRAWTELPKDTYKSNGRVRHESVNIHIGPLCNIQVHSYQ